MKKTGTHLVYSTKKVKQKVKEKEPTPKRPTAVVVQEAPAADAMNTHAHGPAIVLSTATTPTPTLSQPGSARENLVVDTVDIELAPTPTRRLNSTGSSRSVSTEGSSRSHRSHSHSHPHSHRSSSSSSSRRSTRLGERSVKRLRPSPPLLQKDSVTVAQCIKVMVEKKADATLLVDVNGRLTGILTDRDVAFKVVAVGRDPKTTLVSEVMTPDPLCVAPNASAIDALMKMVSGQFRHLPVIDKDRVVGIVDIAKCLYEAIVQIEKDYYASSKNLSEAIKKIEERMPSESRENLFEKLREKLFLPTLSEILTERSPVPKLRPSSTALDAAVLMLMKKTSATMVCTDDGEMVGIFTSKDLMRRVVAVDLAPEHCVLSGVMTVNPFSARLSTTILETLHTMHNGKFLHVPVFDESHKLVGLVDVLQASYAIVHQIGMLQLPKNESVQPLWNQLRESFVHTDEPTESEELDEDDADRQGGDDNDGGTDHSASELSSLDRHLSWSESKDNEYSDNGPEVADPDSPEFPGPERPPDVFVFKLADSNGANHRFTSSAESLKELIHDVKIRLGDHTIRKLHYIDDDGDHVLLFTDTDLKDAVKRARMWGNKYIRLIVLHRASRPRTRTAGAHHHDNALGIVYYAAAAAAIAGASFFLSRRR